MKKLITEKTVAEFAKNGEKVFSVDDNTLITPSAKDLARNEGITFKFVDEQNSGNSYDVVSHASCMTPKKDEHAHGSCVQNRECKSKISAENREKIVEAVIKVLADKGILNQIIDK